MAALKSKQRKAIEMLKGVCGKAINSAEMAGVMSVINVNGIESGVALSNLTC